MTPWVKRIMIVNALAFVLTLVSPNMELVFGLVPAAILVRPWTIFTYMFIHAGIWHIGFNMLGLYFFGPRVEFRLGGRDFLLLYFISGISGAVLSFFFTPYTLIVGASGAIFGVFVAFAHYWPREPVYIYGLIPIESRWLVVIMTVLSLMGGFGGFEPDVAHFAHLGGFVGGYIFVRILEMTSRGARFRAKLKPAAPRADDLERWRRIRRDSLHEVNREEYDRVMAKLMTSGIESLTDQEIAFLNRFSQE